MNADSGGPIVVGVSRTTGSGEALRWAVAEGRYRGAVVHAVMAWRAPRTQSGPGVSPPAFPPADPGQLQAEAEARLATLVRATLGDGHGVRCEAVRGSTVKVLLTAASDAQLLVLDAPRSGSAATAIRPGMVAPQLAYRAPCPVVMVPPAGGTEPTGNRAVRR